MKVNFKRKLDSLVGDPLILINVAFAKLFSNNKRRQVLTEPKTIVFIKLLGIGSVVLALDALGSVRKKYPNVKMVMICNPAMKKGIEPFELFDEYWLIEDKDGFKLISSALSTLWKCWKSKALWTIDLEIYSKLTTIFSFWTFASNRIGFYKSIVSFRNSLYTHLTYFNSFKPVAENYERMVKDIGIEDINFHEIPTLPYSKRAIEKGMPFIAINNTCSDLAIQRKMEPNTFQAIIRHLLKYTNKKIAIVGAPSDREQLLNDSVEFNNNDRVTVVAGEQSLLEYYRFLYAECSFMVTVDSLPLHISRRLGLATFSVWGPTNPSNYLKEIKADFSYERHPRYYDFVHCSPCVHHTDILPCKGDNICMKDVNQQKLEDQLSELLKNLEVHQENHEPKTV